MHTFHEFDHQGKHYRLVYDEDHETIGSFAYDTPEETKAAEDEEIQKLSFGEWVALGCIVTEPCDGRIIRPNKTAPVGILRGHCTCCSGTHEVDSLWGIVIENSIQMIEDYVKEIL